MAIACFRYWSDARKLISPGWASVEGVDAGDHQSAAAGGQSSTAAI